MQASRAMPGFSLLELMIAIAIIGILAAIVIPTYQGSVRKANEASAVAALNTIKIAQAKYVIDHKGQCGTFRQLYAEGYLDKRFNYDKPVIRGYVFRVTLTPKRRRKSARLCRECGSGTINWFISNRQKLLLHRSGKWHLL